MSLRNQNPIPLMGDEGIFLGPVPSLPEPKEGEMWYKNLSPNHRLYYHQTLNSIRKMRNFKQTWQIPKDDLDFLLLSRYNQSLELFADRPDTVMQPETAGEKTFRKLRNTKDLPFIKKEHLGHPLKIGGITEKISPHSVKLMNSGHHTQLTNPGYSRQTGDGNFFKY